MQTATIAFSRRRLLKAGGLAAVLGSLGVPFDPAAAAEKGRGVHLTPKMKDGWHYGHCRMCMRGTCPNLYRVENGIAVEVMGNPATPTTRGALCAKGQSIIQNTYNAYRVKAPMKRTNPKKGLDVDPQWVEISWDEALDTVAKRLKSIHDRDPRRFLYQVGFGDMDFFCTFMFYFAQTFGTPNFVKSNGILCTLHYASDLVQGVFPGSVPDATYCRYFIAMGSTSAWASAPAKAARAASSTSCTRARRTSSWSWWIRAAAPRRARASGCRSVRAATWRSSWRSSTRSSTRSGAWTTTSSSGARTAPTSSGPTATICATRRASRRC